MKFDLVSDDWLLVGRKYDVRGGGLGSVYSRVPASSTGGGELEDQGLVFHVHDDMEIFLPFGKRAHGEGEVAHFPVWAPEALTVPFDVGNAAGVALGAREKMVAAQAGVALAESDDFLGETESVPVGVYFLPVEPADGIVLAIAVVVALLAAQDLVAS